MNEWIVVTILMWAAWTAFGFAVAVGTRILSGPSGDKHLAFGQQVVQAIANALCIVSTSAALWWWAR